MGIGGVVDDQVDDHPQTERFRMVHELHEVAGGAVLRVDAVEVADVVAVVAVRRGMKVGAPKHVSSPATGLERPVASV